MLRTVYDPGMSVWAVLAMVGPVTLAELASITGHCQGRLRTHLRAHRDAYACRLEDRDGVRIRLWFTQGAIE